MVDPLWAALTGDASTQHGLHRNITWRHFMKLESGVDFDDTHAEAFSDDLAADLREAAGRYPDDAGLAMLITRLQADSPEFARRWHQAHIARHRSSRKIATATAVGPITVDCDVLTAPGTDLRIVLYTVTPGSEDSSKLDLLRVSGTQTLTS